jgi:hypothetical protein
MWAVFAYFIIVAVGNYVHEYYQLVVLIPGSVLVGRGVALCFENVSKWKKPAVWLLIIVALAWLPLYGYLRSTGRMKFDLTYRLAGEALAQVSSPKDRALVISDGEPEVLYYAHRKGWHLEREKYTLDWVNWYIPQGVKYVVVKGKERKELTALPKNVEGLEKTLTSLDQRTINELKGYFPVVKQTDWYWIFRTDKPTREVIMINPPAKR